MDIEIGEMNSTLNVTDSEALLDPRVLDQIVRVVMARLREEEARARRRDEERRVTSSVTGGILRGE